MKVISSYKVKILHYNHIFDETVSAYQKAVAFFLHVCKKELIRLHADLSTSCA